MEFLNFSSARFGQKSPLWVIKDIFDAYFHKEKILNIFRWNFSTKIRPHKGPKSVQTAPLKGKIHYKESEQTRPAKSWYLKIVAKVCLDAFVLHH